MQISTSVLMLISKPAMNAWHNPVLFSDSDATLNYVSYYMKFCLLKHVKCTNKNGQN